MNIIKKIAKLYQQDKYADPNDRCWECENWTSYCYDEYDADAYCELGLNEKEKYCPKFIEEKE
jgi:hypothetical protein